MDRIRLFIALMATQVVRWPSQRFARLIVILCTVLSIVIGNALWGIATNIPEDTWWRLIEATASGQPVALAISSYLLLFMAMFGFLQHMMIHYTKHA